MTLLKKGPISDRVCTRTTDVQGWKVGEILIMKGFFPSGGLSYMSSKASRLSFVFKLPLPVMGLAAINLVAQKELFVDKS